MSSKEKKVAKIVCIILAIGFVLSAGATLFFR